MPSAAGHCGDKDATDLLDLSAWFKRWRVDPWKQELRRPEDAALVVQMRRCLHIGCPLVSGRFITKLEAMVGKRLRPVPVGRPRKKGRKTAAGDGRRK